MWVYLFDELVVDRQVDLLLLVLVVDELELLLDVAEYLHGVVELLLELHELLVALLDLLVVRLILDLELLEVDHVQAVAELLARLQLVLALRQLILQPYVLDAHADHLALLARLSLQIELDLFERERTARLRRDRVHARVALDAHELAAILLHVVLLELALELDVVHLELGLEAVALQLLAQRLDRAQVLHVALLLVLC